MKFGYFLPILALSLAATSCNDKDGNSTFNSSVLTLNVVTTLDNGSTSITPSLYTLDFIAGPSIQSGTISSSYITFGGETYSLLTPSINYATDGYTFYFKDVTGDLSNSMGNEYEMKNGQFYLTPMFYVPTQTPYLYPNQALLGEYFIGSQYRVNTFPDITCFVGTTKVTYQDNGSTQTYTNDNAIFQVSLDLNNQVGEVIINNAQFKQNGLPIALLKIPALQLSANNGTIYLQGTNVAVAASDSMQGTTVHLNFSSINFQTTSQDLTKGTLSFVVNDEDGYIYTGSISGAYTTYSIQ